MTYSTILSGSDRSQGAEWQSWEKAGKAAAREVACEGFAAVMPPGCVLPPHLIYFPMN